jgi:hypothetical protein
VEKRYRNSTQRTPVFAVWAWPLVLRNIFIAYVKEKMWLFCVVPRTPRFLRAQGEDGTDLYEIVLRWLKARPGGSEQLGSNETEVLTLSVATWSNTEGTAMDNTFDELDILAIQQNVEHRLGAPSAEDYLGFEQCQQNLHGVLWFAYQNQLANNGRLVRQRQHCAKEALEQIVRYGRDDTELWCEHALGFLFADDKPTAVDKMLGESTTRPPARLYL